jgi:hypothetical protein
VLDTAQIPHERWRARTGTITAMTDGGGSGRPGRRSRRRLLAMLITVILLAMVAGLAAGLVASLAHLKRAPAARRARVHAGSHDRSPKRVNRAQKAETGRNIRGTQTAGRAGRPMARALRGGHPDKPSAAVVPRRRCQPSRSAVLIRRARAAQDLILAVGLGLWLVLADLQHQVHGAADPVGEHQAVLRA